MKKLSPEQIKKLEESGKVDKEALEKSIKQKEKAKAETVNK